MVKKQKQEKKSLLAEETVESIAAVISFLVALIFTLAWFGKAGKVGQWILVGFTFLLGKAYFLLPLVLILMGAALLFSLKERVLGSSLIGSLLLLVSGLGLSEIAFGRRTGGLVGEFAIKPFVYLFDTLATAIIFGTLVLVSVLIVFNASLRRSWRRHEATLKAKLEIPSIMPVPSVSSPIKEEVVAASEAVSTSTLERSKKEEPKKDISAELLRKLKVDPKKYVLPPLSLLDSTKGKPSAGDVRANANIIQRTLQDFGIPVEIAEVNIGPSVTQYAIKPAQGIKLSRIVGLQNDLALALAAHPLRIEAPIPGKSYVGIEIPNRLIALVGLRSLLEEESYQKGGPLVFALGKDVSGRPLFADLARMPHLLVAGSTGTGKSVSIHSFLMNLLYKNTPLSLRLILIDPKRVELAHYQDIPHLLAPVITESKDTISALRWAVKEMEGRYKTLQQSRKRDIVSYNSSGGDYMPYIVIVVDELADLMASYGREVEASIVRLAQMARAVGIHLVLSTQRPSVEVITGLIKANITSRIAFQVPSQIDSRTILDTAGAEKLLGNGDMLFLAGDVAKPKRLQGAFTSEAEVKRVTEYICNQETEPEYNDAVLTAKADSSHGSGTGEEGDGDELYDEAYNIILETGKASTTYLQRRLKIGYARAARLMDLLEQKGVIGPGDGAKAREVFIRDSDPDNNIHVA